MTIYTSLAMFGPDKNWEEMSEQLTAEKNKKVSAHRWTDLPYSSLRVVGWNESREAHVFRIPASVVTSKPSRSPLGYQLPRSSQSASSYAVHPNGEWIGV